MVLLIDVGKLVGGEWSHIHIRLEHTGDSMIICFFIFVLLGELSIFCGRSSYNPRFLTFIRSWLTSSVPEFSWCYIFWTFIRILEGSKDGGSSWYVLDRQTSQKCENRFQRKLYKIELSNTQSNAFRYLTSTSNFPTCFRRKVLSIAFKIVNFAGSPFYQSKMLTRLPGYKLEVSTCMPKATSVHVGRNYGMTKKRTVEWYRGIK